MPKPETIKDLLIAGHIDKSEVRAIARSIFDGKTQGAGPEGYLFTAAKWDDLPETAKQFIMKAILEFKVENVLEHGEELTPDHSDFTGIDTDDADD